LFNKELPQYLASAGEIPTELYHPAPVLLAGSLTWQLDQDLILPDCLYDCLRDAKAINATFYYLCTASNSRSVICLISALGFT